MKMNWGTLIGIVYLAFVGGMIMLAFKSSEQKLELVTDNYYEEAVNYQNRIDAKNNASNSASLLSINYINSSNELEIKTSNVNGRRLSGSLNFYKPDKAAEDYNLNFELRSSGTQIIPLKKMAHGYWKVIATWKDEEKSFYKEKKIFIP